MKFSDFKKLCLSYTAAVEESPYREDENMVAYKVMEKVFAITNPDTFEYIHIKCDPVKAAMLRNLYEEVQPSQFENERHWNTVYLSGILDDEIIYEWIRDSYELVFENLPRKKQRVIEAMEEE
jgi:predicted DNA-binding protein (MmcQ/YjbR family)